MGYIGTFYGIDGVEVERWPETGFYRVIMHRNGPWCIDEKWLLRWWNESAQAKEMREGK